MRFLGIHYGHNATLCLMEDGKVTFCQSEERLNRLKNATGFPFRTLEYVYERICPPERIDRAILNQRSPNGYLYLKAHGFQPTQYAEFLEGAFIGRTSLKQRLLRNELGWRLYTWRYQRRAADPRIRREAHEWFARTLRLPADRVDQIDHHETHAQSVLPSVRPWGRALIFTIDGAGDGLCATVSLFEGGKLRRLSADDHRNSLGYYYAAVTRAMGMRPGEHEYKVMGLAPYAKPSAYHHITDRLQRLLTVDDRGRWRSAVTPAALGMALQDVFRYERFDHVAGAIQELTETLVCRWIEHWIGVTGCGDIGAAGGVFMNVKMSQRVLALPSVGRFFVMPSAADESCAIGCVNWANATYDREHPAKPLADLYLGMSFSDADVERAVTATGAAQRFEISRPADINAALAELLASGQIVARCSGRMEFGARALGNRSILADASDVRKVEVINDAIKNRDFWMPFAPSILEEDMARYVVDSERIFAPYMAITFDGTPEAQRDLAAAVHPRDKTLRPQAVVREWNPDYWAVLDGYKRRTGRSGILNTSFNLHGEPVVCSPEDAIRTVDTSGLEHLALGSYLLKKRSARRGDATRTSRVPSLAAPTPS